MGSVGDGHATSKLLVIGESTIAGLGARNHELALTGQFAQRLGKRIGKKVNWTVIGKNPTGDAAAPSHPCLSV